MRLYVDSANINKITKLNEYYPISGVTTNPTLLVNEEKPYLDTLKEIRAIIGNDKELFVQTIGESAKEIIEESHYIMKQLPGKVIVKIPVTEEGIKAMKVLSGEGIPILATTIYTAFQALTAALSGAKYVAPYVNRIDNLASNGIGVVAEISQLFKVHNISCEILAASFKNLQQVYDVCLVGAETVTVDPEIIEKMIGFPATVTDVSAFKQQWQNAYGKSCTTLINSKYTGE